VTAIERALGHRIQQAEGRHHGAGRQHLDLELAAGHVVDLFCEVERVFVEDVLARPGALEAQLRRSLRRGDHRHAQGRDGCAASCVAEELAAGRNCLIGHLVFLFHRMSPVLFFSRCESN
jgi:hypothetical protein